MPLLWENDEIYRVRKYDVRGLKLCYMRQETEVNKVLMLLVRDGKVIVCIAYER